MSNEFKEIEEAQETLDEFNAKARRVLDFYDNVLTEVFDGKGCYGFVRAEIFGGTLQIVHDYAVMGCHYSGVEYLEVPVEFLDMDDDELYGEMVKLVEKMRAEAEKEKERKREESEKELEEVSRKNYERLKEKWGMNEQKAREILGNCISGDVLFNISKYISWSASRSNATLDGEFSVEELEAIAWWMRNKKIEESEES